MTERKTENKKSIFKKTKDFFDENDWNIDIFILTVIAFVVNIIGFSQMFEENNLNGNMMDYIYYSIRTFIFDFQTPKMDTHIPWMLEIGRWLSATATIMIVLLALKNVFKDKWALFKRGNNHIIIVGAGQKGKTLMLDWIKEMESPSAAKKLIVCIEKDKNNPNIDALKDKGIIFIFGEAQDEDVLEKAKAIKSDYFVTLTDMDTTNIEIVSTLMKMKDINKTIKCYIHIANNEFYDFFRANRFKENKNIDIKVFNLHSNSARMLLRDKENLLGKSVFKTASDLADSSKKVRVAILGFGKLAESILIHILQLGHFYNANPIEVTVIYDNERDENINLEDEFNNHYDVLKEEYNGKYWDVKLIDDGYFDDMHMEFDHVVIAYENEFESLSNLMKMLKKYNDKIIDNKIDIAIYSNSFKNTAEVIQEDKLSKGETVFKYVRTFGEINKTCSYDMVINESLDKMAILNNRQYNTLHGYSDKTKTAEEEWQSLDIFTKDSNRYLIEHMPMKKYIIETFIQSRNSSINKYEEIKNSISEKFFSHEGMKPINWDSMGVDKTKYATHMSEEEIINLGKLEHRRWNAFHILNGWKTMSLEQLNVRVEGLIGHDEKDGKQKDRVKKLHSCIVSWEELDNVSNAMNHDYKSDDIETIMRIPSLEDVLKRLQKK